MIIGLAGYAGSGKDTVGRLIQCLEAGDIKNIPVSELLDKYESHGWWLEGKSGWRLESYAGKLKMVASLLTGVSATKFSDPEFKKSNLSKEWDFMSVREFLQRLGTDAMRKGLHESVWINALMANYTPRDKWVVTDVRFPDEAQAIKSRGGWVWRIVRNGITPVNNHISEIALDHWKFDQIIENHGTIPELMSSVSMALKTLFNENKTSKH